MTERYESENNRDEAELETERYGSFSDGADGVVVYDRQNDAAWVKSDAAVEIGEMA
jgi:hypothetical protein